MLVFQKLFTFLYKCIVKPLILRTKPDKVHDMMLAFGEFSGKIPPLMWALKLCANYQNKMLEVDVFNTKFKNPLGLGAGMDKKVQLLACLRNIGLSHSTVGSITRYHCKGNDRPWFHRILEQKSFVVNVGLAGPGIELLTSKLRPYKDMLLSVSIALTNDKKKKQTLDEAIEEYRSTFSLCKDTVSMIEINISCPNAQLGEMFCIADNLDRLLSVIDQQERNIPVVLKMPSDKTIDEFLELCKIASKHNVQGLTICNLKKDRSGINLSDEIKGNLSGKPTQDISNTLLKHTYKNYGERFVLIGLGGVFNADDAYEKIKSGATLVQLVTSLVYEGPQVAAEINRGLVKLLKADGYTSIKEAIGKGVS